MLVQVSSIVLRVAFRKILRAILGVLEYKMKMKSIDQEPMQSNPISCPRHQTGKERKQLRRNKVKSQKDSIFQKNGHQAIVNRTHKKSKTNRKRTNNDK